MGPAAIRFVLNGEATEVAGLPPTTTVLQYLREVRGLTGTKEGCAEGDCGACTVVLGERAACASSAAAAGVQYRAINACIRLLPTIDGKELVTVEGLSTPDEALHPVQQAMVEHHGSQCGFCTPGFVMSLFAHYQSQKSCGREAIVSALSGNLCRCTGYRPIIEAGCNMRQLPASARWPADAASDPDRLAALDAVSRQDTLALPGFIAPRSLDELARLRLARPEALILAGGTDVGLWVTKQLRELPDILYIGEVAELHQLSRDADGLTIGAAVSLSDAWAAIVQDYPAMAELAERFASPPVRNSGTLGGNLANGSPIGDSMPALIAIGAEVTLRRGDAVRRLPLEQLYLDYMKKDLAPGEFLVAVHLPPPPPDLVLEVWKLSKRIDQDISAVCAGIAITLSGDTVASARIAFGGMAATPRRAASAEAALVGQPWTLASIEAAIAALEHDFTPLSDMRASSAYRQTTAGNLLKRFFLLHGGADRNAPLRTRALEQQA